MLLDGPKEGEKLFLKSVKSLIEFYVMQGIKGVGIKNNLHALRETVRNYDCVWIISYVS